MENNVLFKNKMEGILIAPLQIPTFMFYKYQLMSRFFQELDWMLHKLLSDTHFNMHSIYVCDIIANQS